MLSRRVVFWAVNRTQSSLAGDAPLELRAYFIGGPFFERIGAAGREQDNREE
jgi:hypothetical protein